MVYGVADICLKHPKPEMNPFNQTKSERRGGERTRKREPVNTGEDVETIRRKQQEKERNRNLAQ